MSMRDRWLVKEHATSDSDRAAWYMNQIAHFESLLEIEMVAGT